jgi:hypothetical protein
MFADERKTLKGGLKCGGIRKIYPISESIIASQ